MTTVYVTHDQVEAMTMGDRVCVLKDGELQQVDTPLALYDTPENLFVASFIGSPAMNIIDATPSEGGANIGTYVVPVDRTATSKLGQHGQLKVGVRPENWELVGDGEDGLAVEVVLVEELGADAYLYGSVKGASSVDEIVARIDPRRPPAKGSTVRLATDPEKVHVFDAESGERLSD